MSTRGNDAVVSSRCAAWLLSFALMVATLPLLPTGVATAQVSEAGVVARINSGGPAVTTAGGVAWEADRYFAGGSTYSAPGVAVAGTGDDVLYQTERWVPSSYAIPVPAAGEYTVRLHFAEMYFTGGGVGQRVFGVNLEGGSPELADYDINAQVGPLTADVKAFALPVNDGTLNIQFLAQVSNPLIDAIEVLAGDQLPSAPPPPSTGNAYADLIRGAGPLGYWRLGETSGTRAADASGHGRHGVYEGGPTLGRPGGVADADLSVGMDGYNDRVTIPYIRTLSSDRGSVEAWFRSTEPKAALITSRGGYSQYGGQLALQVGGAGSQRAVAHLVINGAGVMLTGTRTITEGRWHHLAATYDGMTARLFVDGVEQASQAVTGTLDTSPFPIGIGGFSGHGQYTARGDIDEVAYYNRALTSTELAERLETAAQPPLSCTGGTSYADVVCSDRPLSYWSLDETSGITATDRSSIANTASYQGSPQLGVPGIAGTAARFDGYDDRVEASYDGYGRYATDRGSVEAWFRTTQHRPALITGRGGYSQYGGQLTLQVGGEGDNAAAQLVINGAEILLTGTSNIVEGRWHHLSATYDGTTARLYVDGVQEATHDISGTLDTKPFAIGIGGFNGHSQYAANGDIDEVAYYDRALSPTDLAERLQMALRPPPPTCTGTAAYSNAVCSDGPLAYWSLDEASDAASAQDRTTLGNHANYVRFADGPVVGVGGAVGKAVRFGGSGRIEAGYDAYGRYAVNHGTVEAWFRMDEPRSGLITSRGGHGRFHGQLGLQIGGDNAENPEAHFVINDASVTLTARNTRLIPGPWYHLAATYDGEVARLYVNGSEVASQAVAGALHWKIGIPFGTGGFNGHNYDLRGSIDEVAYYGYALTPSDLADRLRSAGRMPPVPVEQTFGCGCNSMAAARPVAWQADPINTATGAASEVFPDLALPGNGVTFDLTRAYTSADATAGPLGPGWTHPYHTQLLGAGTARVVVRGEDGQQIGYTRRSDGSFAGDPGAQSTLSATAGGYAVTTPDKRVLTFDSTGLLTTMKDRHGIGLTLTHNGGRLATVTDAANRTVVFSYDSAGLLTRVTLPDSRYVEYGYTGGRLTTSRDARGAIVKTCG